MKEFDLHYSEYLSIFEKYADKYMQTLVTKPVVLGESMQYSFLNGGKRNRID